jgi:L-lactate dehydrogenase complex protein LldG
MTSLEHNEARESILRSIRSHLAESVARDAMEDTSHHAAPVMPAAALPANGSAISLVELFKENLEAVDGHCVVAHSELDIVRAISSIIADLQTTSLQGRRLAISDQPEVARLVRLIAVEVDELAITPNAHDLFHVDVGITSVQAAIAETGTLVLDSACERHRLISLVPPVHIAIVEASRIYETIGETLARLRSDKEISPAVTFITGPSRTADIELTLAIGVHGPQELFVIVHDDLVSGP